VAIESRILRSLRSPCRRPLRPRPSYLSISCSDWRSWINPVTRLVHRNSRFLAIPRDFSRFLAIPRDSSRSRFLALAIPRARDSSRSRFLALAIPRDSSRSQFLAIPRARDFSRAGHVAALLLQRRRRFSLPGDFIERLTLDNANEG